MDLKHSLQASLKSAWIVLKLVIPIYIIAEVLYFYNLLSHVSFLFEPLTTLVGLPAEASLAIISGFVLNIYAALAFAVPLELTPKEWTILGVLLGVCHAIIVENAIMKRIGISNLYSLLLRVISGFVLAYLVALLPEHFFSPSFTTATYTAKSYESLSHLFQSALYEAFILAFEIIVLITAVIFLMDFLKSRAFIKNSSKNISKHFSIVVGMLLGITYGAGLLIKEAESQSLSKEDILYVGTFLMICHSIIEDTLLFVIFGADLGIIVTTRIVAAVIIAGVLVYFYKKRLKKVALT